MGEGKSIPMNATTDLPVNMGEHRGKPEKMSYEQLENIAHQFSDQNRQLHADLLKAQEVGFFKRLDYLFRVVDNPGAFNSTFWTNCRDEVETIMTIPESILEEAKSNKD